MSDSGEIHFTIPKSCEKRRGESARAYAAFLAYCRMGPGRSLQRLHRLYTTTTPPEAPPTRSLDTLKDWSGRNAWIERLADWERAEAVFQARVWEGRRRMLLEQDWRDGQALRDQARELLEAFPRFIRRQENNTIGPGGEALRVITLALNTTPIQLAQMFKAASELQRLAIGEPTELFADVSSDVLDAIIERELAGLAGIGQTPIVPTATGTD